MPILIIVPILMAITYVGHRFLNKYLTRLQPAIDWKQLIVEQLPCGIVVLDGSLKTIFCNTSAATMLGHQLQDIVGNSFTDLLFPCIDENGETVTLSNFPPTITLEMSKPIVNFRLGYYKPDGKQVWVMISSQIVNQGKTNDRKLLVTLDDISSFQAEQQRKTSLELEQERSKMIGQFVQSASHEFRTPLSILQLNLDLLVQKKIDKNLLRYVNQANTQIKRLVRLVDTLLMIAELDSWNTLPLHKISVNKLLNHSIDQITKSDDIQSRTLDLEITSDLPKISGNDYYLIIALEEIIGNAIRHTAVDSTISVQAKSDNNIVEIIIEDTGTGINSEEVMHAFKRFWRKDKMHSTPGFGLGLPLARRIIELHYGNITLESKPMIGTKVTVSLPGNTHVKSVVQQN